jgi:hypothetical protein
MSSTLFQQSIFGRGRHGTRQAPTLDMHCPCQGLHLGGNDGSSFAFPVVACSDTTDIRAMLKPAAVAEVPVCWRCPKISGAFTTLRMQKGSHGFGICPIDEAGGEASFKEGPPIRGGKRRRRLKQSLNPRNCRDPGTNRRTRAHDCWIKQPRGAYTTPCLYGLHGDRLVSSTRNAWVVRCICYPRQRNEISG